jgi:hypothetical protein
MTSTLETFGMSNTAALAGSAPVIASPVGGIVTTTFDSSKSNLLKQFSQSALKIDSQYPSSDFYKSLSQLESSGRNAIWIDQPSAASIEIERAQIIKEARDLFTIPPSEIPPATRQFSQAISQAIEEGVNMSRIDHAKLIASGLNFTHVHLTPRAIGVRYKTYIDSLM